MLKKRRAQLAGSMSCLQCITLRGAPQEFSIIYWGTCVDLPQPVLPAIMTTWLFSIVSRMSCLSARMTSERTSACEALAWPGCN